MATSPICPIPNCNKPVRCRGWCNAHYQRWVSYGDPQGGGAAKGDHLRYFRETVLPFMGNECLTWPYGCIGNGYGQIFYKGRKYLVSRLVCEIVYGPAPSPKHEAAHSCGKGHEACCNPQHLRWATAVENAQDRIPHGTRLRGERQNGAKLSKEDVLQIRALFGKLANRKIAKRFGVSYGAINGIRYRKNWAWVE